jgi:CheY-like chemotaxis protein
VTIESSPGCGTTVTIVLPMTLRDPVTRAEPGGEVLAKIDAERRGHVLLVEDDQEVAALTRELLGTLGFAVIHVGSADAALGALADSRTIDLVLSDIMMPGGVNGVQLAREIRRRYPTLPVILTTGYVEAAADAKDGEFPMLPKPFTLETLADALGVEAAARD